MHARCDVCTERRFWNFVKALIYSDHFNQSLDLGKKNLHPNVHFTIGNKTKTKQSELF